MLLYNNSYFIISWPDTIFKQNLDFCAHASLNGLKRDAGGKKGKLSCCKCIFNQIKANFGPDLAWKPPKCPKNARNSQNLDFRFFCQTPQDNKKWFHWMLWSLNSVTERRIAQYNDWFQFHLLIFIYTNSDLILRDLWFLLRDNRICVTDCQSKSRL